MKNSNLKIWHLLQVPNRIGLISCKNGKKYKRIYVQRRQALPLKIKLKLPWFSPALRPASFSSSSLSSAHFAQPVVCLGVGYDGLNGYDGLVDLCLELPQLLDVQQAQDLGRFVQSGISSIKTQDVLV